MFANKSQLSNYTYDNTLCASNKTLINLKNHITNNFGTLTKWKQYGIKSWQISFYNTGFEGQNSDFHYKNAVIKNKIEEITIDNKLAFKSHMKNICINAI